MVSRSKSRSRSPPRFQARVRGSEPRERDTRSTKEILKEREIEEEEKEIKRAARKAEEKEAIYQVSSFCSFHLHLTPPPGAAEAVGGEGGEEGEGVREGGGEGEEEDGGDGEGGEETEGIP